MFEDLIKKDENLIKKKEKILTKDSEKSIEGIKKYSSAERIQNKINKIWGIGKAKEPSVKIGKTYRIKWRKCINDEKSIDSSSTSRR